MNQITQYLPAYVETMGEPAPCAEFKTVAELEAIPFVARWKVSADGNEFHRFSLSENCLMAELNGGRNFHVVGFIKHPSALDLPTWTAPART